MRRRDFLRGALAALIGGGSAPSLSLADTVPDPVRASFAAARRRHPWLLGYATASQARFHAPAERIHGSMPAGLRGSFYRNGPGAHEIAGRRYHHWFDGDGLVQAFRLHAGDVTHSARFVETEKRRREGEAGRPLEPGFGTHWPDLAGGGLPDDGNAANISVLSHAGQLLALWEGGAAHALDPESLATLGPWFPDETLRGLPFSAHPRVEPDGTLWNFGSAPWARRLLVYRFSTSGSLVSATPIAVDHPAMVHDFVVTERHVVFVLPPLLYENESHAPTFLERHRWDGSRPTRLLVLEKSALDRPRWVEAPTAFVFHLANAFERDGRLHVDGCFYPNADLVFGEQRRVMWGEWPGTARLARTRRLTVELGSGTVKAEDYDGFSEFPTVDPRHVGRPHRFIHQLERLPDSDAAHPLFDALVRLDPESGNRAVFRFPANWIPEEHVFVPHPGGDTDRGWLVGTALDVGSKRTQLQVFDAADVASGPVGIWRLPYVLPLGLHGNFVPA